MRLRTAALILPLALGLLAAPLPAEAQEAGKVYRVGYAASAAPASLPEHSPFAQALKELGWVDDRNVSLEWRWAGGKVERLRDLVRELVRLGVDVLVVETTPGTRYAMEATRTIPIVFMFVSDPVGSGYVQSVARPGGNVTGVTNIFPELSGKLLELLREAVPGVSQVGVLWNPLNPAKALEFRELQPAARMLGVTLQSHPVQEAGDLEQAFAAMVQEGAEAVITLAEAFTYTHRQRLAELALRHRLPTIFNFTPHVDAGGLMSYSPSTPAMFRRAAALVDKILKGTEPADLPVKRPTHFEFVVNLKTAKALGLTIPDSILFRADRVIR